MDKCQWKCPLRLTDRENGCDTKFWDVRGLRESPKSAPNVDVCTRKDDGLFFLGIRTCLDVDLRFSQSNSSS